MKAFLQFGAAGLAFAALIGCPSMARADNPTVEAEIVQLARDHAEQARAELIVDPILSEAAQAKADDMLARGYLAHVSPEGVGPNFLVQVRGYFLPAGYDNARSGNNIESIFEDRGFGPADAQLAFEGWLGSPSHRQHVLGELAFFAEQVRVGVGVASNGDEENPKNIYVFFSAAPPAADDVLPPVLAYVRPKARSRPNRIMFHRGFADDPSGIRRVQIRVLNRAFADANYFTEDRRWTGRTRLAGAFARKVKRGRKPLVIQVRAQDEAGNWSRNSRRFVRR